MNTKVLLLEGYHASGKSTLIGNLEKHLKDSGMSYLMVGRDYKGLIKLMTSIVLEEEFPINPSAEVLIRLARDIERAKLTKQYFNDYDFFIFDRSVVSTISWIKFFGHNTHKYAEIVSEIVNSMGPCHLIYCNLPFEDTWERIHSRDGKVVSENNEQDKVDEQIRYQVYRQTYLDFNFPTVNKIEIDTRQSREDCLTDLLIKLDLK